VLPGIVLLPREAIRFSFESRILFSLKIFVFLSASFFSFLPPCRVCMKEWGAPVSRLDFIESSFEWSIWSLRTISRRLRSGFLVLKVPVFISGNWRGGQVKPRLNIGEFCL
jgi:hypothetical protein